MKDFEKLLCERGDWLENTAHQFLCDIAEMDLQWDISIIREVLDAATQKLQGKGIHICDPAYVSSDDNPDEDIPCYKCNECPMGCSKESCPMTRA